MIKNYNFKNEIKIPICQYYGSETIDGFWISNLDDMKYNYTFELDEKVYKENDTIFDIEDIKPVYHIGYGFSLSII